MALWSTSHSLCSAGHHVNYFQYSSFASINSVPFPMLSLGMCISLIFDHINSRMNSSDIVSLFDPQKMKKTSQHKWVRKINKLLWNPTRNNIRVMDICFYARYRPKPDRSRVEAISTALVQLNYQIYVPFNLATLPAWNEARPSFHEQTAKAHAISTASFPKYCTLGHHFHTTACSDSFAFCV